MKGLIIRGVSVSSILFFFISCTSYKIDTNEEKIAILNQDYKIDYYNHGKNNINPTFQIKVFVDEEKYLTDIFLININGVWTTVNDTIFSCYVYPNQKYDIDISTMGHKKIKIRNVKVSEKDSIVINAYLKEYPVLY